MQCGEFFLRWRSWIRPLLIAIYVIVLVIALPLMIVELNLNGAKTHTQAWLIGGLFVVLAIPISIWGILQHMIHYTQPHLQRHIIRILWMVPIYALDAWLALRFKDLAIYLDTLRECYEAYVVYNFMAYLLSFLHSQYPDLEAELESKPQVKHLIPFCYLPPWQMGRPLIQHCRHGVLQYTVIRPLTTIIALICQKLHVYQEGDFNFKSAWIYLSFINNVSQVGAMYCLVLFYVATKEHLAPLQPVGKFLCIKAVVFMTFWQSVVIAFLVKVGVIRVDNTWNLYSVEDVATGLQDFLICIEMFLAAIAHYFSFTHKPFVEEGATQADCCASFVAMWDVSDVRADVVDHVRHVGKTVTRTLRRNPASQSERTPLLSGSESGYSQTNMPSVTDFAPVGFTGSRNGSIGTIHSLDASVTETPQSRSFNASMNNFIDLSENSVDVHAAQGPVQNEPATGNLIDIATKSDSQGRRQETGQAKICDPAPDHLENEATLSGSSDPSLVPVSQNDHLQIENDTMKVEGDIQTEGTLQSSGGDPPQPT